MARSLGINLRLRFSAQTGQKKVAPGRLPKELEDFARLIVEDVAVKGVDDVELTYSRLTGPITQILYQELERLAEAMKRGIVGARDGLKGTLNVTSFEGDTDVGGSFARRAGANPRWSFSYPWTPRTQKYLRDKAKVKGHTRWWDYDGKLAGFLNANQLLSTFGPIKVEFERVNKKISGGYTRNELGQFAPADSGRTKVTSLVGVGRPTVDAQILAGRIKVSVLGRITPAMLPGILNGDPADIPPAWSSSLFGLLPGDIQLRLDRKIHRYTIEPYLSWYLSRAVPYAVLRRIGQLRR